MNEYEIIYLYQENNSSKLLFILLDYFTKKLESLQKWLYKKYFFLPLEECDLSLFQFYAIKSCMTSYNMSSKLSFQGYLFKYFRWIVYKYLHKFVSKKYLVLNLANYNFFEYEHCIEVKSESKNYELKKMPFSFFLNFSILEKKVFYLWYKNYSIQQISKLLKLNYRQVDNAKQRIVKKIKKYNVQKLKESE